MLLGSTQVPSALSSDPNSDSSCSGDSSPPNSVGPDWPDSGSASPGDSVSKSKLNQGLEKFLTPSCKFKGFPRYYKQTIATLQLGCSCNGPPMRSVMGSPTSPMRKILCSLKDAYCGILDTRGNMCHEIHMAKIVLEELRNEKDGIKRKFLEAQQFMNEALKDLYRIFRKYIQRVYFEFTFIDIPSGV